MLAFGAGLSAQEVGEVRLSASEGTTGVSYLGDDIRLGVGVDDDGDVHGEYFHVFGEDENSAWIAELWGAEERGGVKLNYHWLNGARSFDDAIGRDQVSIGKVFLAADQNEFDDRKITTGIGIENQRLFWGAYVMANLSGERLVNESLVTDTEIVRFIDSGQIFEQVIVTDHITRLFAHPYDYGVGGRIGRYFESPLIRLRGGVDYEQGDFDNDQLTVSVGLEKYFANTGHSLALTAEYLDKSGSLAADDTDTRALLMYRYSFGERYRPRRDVLERAVALTPEELAAQRKTVMERRPVQNRIEITDEAYFDFDRSNIRPDAAHVLTDVMQRIRGKDIVGDVTVVGHTCNIGTVPYNQALSERRAQAAVNFLVDQNVERGQIRWEGRGELDPKYSNDTEESRRRNRRVEIEFVSMEAGVEEVEVDVVDDEAGRVKWVREPITDPAWMDRALRNPIQHKRIVDFYQYAEEETRVTEQAPVVVNNFPTANPDAATTEQEVAVTIPVLANDTDPDGDALEVTAVTTPTNGTAFINAGGTVTYTPAPGVVGVDTFTYSITDNDGGEDSALVTVTVVAPAVPVVANDDQAQTQRNTSVDIDVLANDSGTGIEITSVGTPDNGTAAASAQGITYTPAAGFVGTDTFTYTITGDNGETDSATVTVSVTAPAGAVVANADTAETLQGQPVTIDVLDNDLGAGIGITDVSQPANGSALISGDSVVYTPEPEFVGTDTFTYSIAGDSGETDSATVTVTVREVTGGENRDPIANDDMYSTPKGVPIRLDVLANDTDPDGDPLTIVAVGTTDFADVTITSDGQLFYIPHIGWFGTDEFTYTISDGRGGEDTATVFITVIE